MSFPLLYLLSSSLLISSLLFFLLILFFALNLNSSSPPLPLLQLSSFCLLWHPSSHLPSSLPLSHPLPLLYLFLLACCLQEVPCQWELLSEPRPRPGWASLAHQQLSWEGTAAARAGRPPVALLWLGPGRSCRAARFQPKQAGPEPAVVLLVEEVYVCVGCLVGWLSSVSQHNKPSGWDLTVTGWWVEATIFQCFLCFDVMWGNFLILLYVSSLLGVRMCSVWLSSIPGGCLMPQQNKAVPANIT